jgi:geranylgeranyl diphosphate synthase type II
MKIAEMNRPPASFPAEIACFKDLIEEQLIHYARFPEGCPAHLADAIRYALLAPGKRIRPLLVLAANRVCDGEIAEALPVACAVEMIHNYSLIHDDLPAMDDDDLRRGRPTVHKEFDEATAILAGDALIPLAFEIIARDVNPPETALEAIRTLAISAGATALVGGQADDLGQQFAEPDLAILEQIHHRKTGALLAASLELGAITARAGLEARNSLRNYGEHLGLAFQIVDDLLDFRGSPATMGKKTNKDAGRGKLTYPLVLGEKQSEVRAREMIEQAIAAIQPFGNSAGSLIQLARFVVDRTH